MLVTDCSTLSSLSGRPWARWTIFSFTSKRCSFLDFSTSCLCCSPLVLSAQRHFDMARCDWTPSDSSRLDSEICLRFCFSVVVNISPSTPSSTCTCKGCKPEHAVPNACARILSSTSCSSYSCWVLSCLSKCLLSEVSSILSMIFSTSSILSVASVTREYILFSGLKTWWSATTFSIGRRAFFKMMR